MGHRELATRYLPLGPIGPDQCSATARVPQDGRLRANPLTGEELVRRVRAGDDRACGRKMRTAPSTVLADYTVT